MPSNYFAIPYYHYSHQAFESLTADILVNGFPRLEGWRFTTGGDPYWRLYWNRQEGACITHDQAEIALDPESILLIPPNTSFNADLTQPVDHFYVHFVLDTPFAVSEPQVWCLKVNAIRRSLLGRIIDIGMQGGLAGQRGQILVYELILDLLSELPAGVWMDQNLDPRIRRALVLIDRRENAAQLDNPMLADAANMSPAGFVRLFSSRMGIPPMRYALERRLARAIILLSHTDRSIDTIAEECGFCDRAHLSKFFKRRFGVGPAHYRKRSLPAKTAT